MALIFAHAAEWTRVNLIHSARAWLERLAPEIVIARGGSPPSVLTPQIRDCSAHCNGLGNKKIGLQVRISYFMVREHVRRMPQKLQVSSRSALLLTPVSSENVK